VSTYGVEWELGTTLYGIATVLVFGGGNGLNCERVFTPEWEKGTLQVKRRESGQKGVYGMCQLENTMGVLTSSDKDYLKTGIKKLVTGLIFGGGRLQVCSRKGFWLS